MTQPHAKDQSQPLKIDFYLMMNAASNTDSCKAVLILFPDGSTIIPASTAAFSVAQGSRRKLSKPYERALILFRTGEIERIVRVEVKGPYGTGLAQKVLSILTSTWSISVHTERYDHATAGDLYKVISNYVIADENSPNPYLKLSAPLKEILQQLERSNDMEEVFSILSVPSVEDCLDVL